MLESKYTRNNIIRQHNILPENSTKSDKVQSYFPIKYSKVIAIITPTKFGVNPMKSVWVCVKMSRSA